MSNEKSNESTFTTKDLAKMILIGFSVLLLAGIIAVAAIVSHMGDLVTKQELKDSLAQTTIGENIADSYGITEALRGGTATITTEDGLEVTYTIPSTHMDLSAQYLEMVQQVYALSTPVVAPNIIVTGDGSSVTDSTGSINASTFSNTRKIYEQIFGDEFIEAGDEAVYSPAYEYLVNGKLPEAAPLNYEVKRLDDIVVGDITYRVLSVDYDTDYTIREDEEGNAIEDPVENIVHTQNVSCYSDTADVIEIVAYTGDNSVDAELALIKEFLTGSAE